MLAGERLADTRHPLQVQTPEYGHIYPLHHQAAHAREIYVNEHPGLHLLWYYDRIFVKPIPPYFLSVAFWDYIRHANMDVYCAALGFMRSYYYLIKYELDYDKACEKKLIPKIRVVVVPGDGGDKEEEVWRYPTYAEFCRFIEQFNIRGNDNICRRYHYGELRLTRINRAAFLWKGKLAYFHIYPQWGSYLHHFLAPIVLVLGGASVVLNAMQVNLNAQEMLKSGGAWHTFVKVALYFPAVTIILVAAVLGISLLGGLGMAVNDVVRTSQTRKNRREGKWGAMTRSHGLI